jgi:serine phosphatase RsbU (regulator of sigma subunit)
MRTEVRERIWRVLILLTFAAVLAYSLVFLSCEFTKVHTLVRMGDIWSFLRIGDEAPAVFTEVSERDFVGPPYPAPGDTLLEMDGLPATARNYFNVFNPNTPPGKVIPVRFMSRGAVHENQVVTRSIPAMLRFQVVSLFILRTILTLALTIVGFWAFVRRPGSAPVRVLALFCFTAAAGTLQGNVAIADQYATFRIPQATRLGALFTAIGLFAPVFFLKLQLVFPKTNAFYERNRGILNALFFLPVFLLEALVLIRRVNPAGLVAAHYTVFLSIGFILLLRNYTAAESFLTKRQTRLVLLGSIPGLVPYAIVPWILFLAPGWFPSRSTVTQLGFFNIDFLLLLLIPLSFAYAFRRHRLLEVEAKVRRGTRLVAINVVFLAAFFAVLYLFGELILKQFQVESRTPTLVVGLILAMGFVPAQRKVREILDRRFYPERARLRALVRDFLQTAERAPDGDIFWKELSARLSEGLGTAMACPVLRRGSTCPGSEDEGEEPFRMLDEVVGRLEMGESPLPVDELMESERAALDDDEKRRLEKSGAAVLLPLHTQSGRIGFLLLGHKTNGEDYSPEEMELLRSLGAQIALAAENLELFHEKLEKQKLEEQLGVARRIQEGLLPRALPEAPGLRLAARIRFCLDVAGDYYDVIPLRDGRTLLAIGDVAGKGIGAALLMSNLQASLRIVRDLGISLADAVRRINALIHENTPPDLFITLFVGIVDPREGSISYVNAGHNYPVLVHDDRRIERLDEGGIPLGIHPETDYVEGRASFGKGSTLLLFTDGVSEAMKPNDEEFGEDRIASLVTAHARRGPEEVVARIEEEVEAFTGETSFGDDFTLLAAAPA